MLYKLISILFYMFLFNFQRMHDMFIQSQIGSYSSGVQVLQGHKKRKLDHSSQHNQTQIDYSSTSDLYSLNNSGTILPVSHHQRRGNISHSNGHNVLQKSPNGGMPQQFIRASTIKLLDTYQRCGQKVIIVRK